jgi:hypothetical protein
MSKLVGYRLFFVEKYSKKLEKAGGKQKGDLGTPN